MAGGLQPPSEEEEKKQAAAKQQGVIFVLENASLEVARVGKKDTLLNCDDHRTFLLRHNKDPALHRPDICHQALLAILDSPLTKSGRLKGLYVRTVKGVLIEIHPQVRLPRTFKRFCGLMVQLLQKFSIHATNASSKLLKVTFRHSLLEKTPSGGYDAIPPLQTISIKPCNRFCNLMVQLLQKFSIQAMNASSKVLKVVKDDVTKHLPPGAKRVAFSRVAPDLVKLKNFVQELPDNTPAVFVVGAMAHGKMDIAYVDQWVSVSEYPLSAACCIGRITNAFEDKWDIV